MSLTNKTIAATYKDLLHLDNANAGLGVSSRTVKDGAGNSTGLHLGQHKVKIQPTVAKADSFSVSNSSGGALLSVDTTNDTVLLGTTQVVATTMYQNFIHNDMQPTVNAHNAISLGASNSPDVNFGTGSTPQATYTTSNDAYKLVDKMWYIYDGITFTGSKVYFASDDAASDTVEIRLMSYDVDGSLNLSNGTVLASGASIANAGYEQGYT